MRGSATGELWIAAKRALVVVPIVLATVVAYSLFASQPPSAHLASASPPAGEHATAKVVREDLVVWSTYLGKLEPRSPVSVMSKARANATLIELVPEGSRVAKGDVLARLNSSLAERDVVKAQREYTLAESELNGFRKAKAPLEIEELTIKSMEARSTYDSERAYLQAMTGLGSELISPPELRRQRDKVAELKTQLEKADMQLRLTREQLHPAEVRRAEAKLAAAESELRLAKQEVQDSVIRAPAPGVVTYSYLYVGPELRTVRVGDNISPNQPFMMVYDTRDLAVQCEVPEAELQKVQPGNEVVIQPLAFPDVRIPAVVERISAVVASPPGRPAWQKSFVAFVRIAQFDPRLRPGMSVYTQVLSTNKRAVLTVPRAAVSWDAGRPQVNVLAGSVAGPRFVKLGLASDGSYEVTEGVREGDIVTLQ